MFILARPKIKEYKEKYVENDSLFQDNFFIQEKKDGWRLTLFSQQNRKLFAFGREILPHLELSNKLVNCEWYEFLLQNLPPFSCIDGELIAKGSGFDRGSVSTLLSQKSADLVFCPFAVPFFNGHSLQFENPHTNTNRLYELFVDRPKDSLIDFPYIPVEQSQLKNATVEELKLRARRENIEGYIIKKYAWSQMYKVKTDKTCSLKAIGYNQGEGKYKDQIGSINLVDSNGTLRASISGFTDYERWEFSNKQELWDQKIIEVMYQRVGVDKLIHPRFLRIREDSLVADSWEKICEDNT